MHLIFGSPRLSASATHSSEYPLPLNTILLCSVSVFLINSFTAVSKSSTPSNSAVIFFNWSATIVFRTIIGKAILCVEPTILNSNLLPVNANGDVLFLSVASIVKEGSVDAPDSYFLPFSEEVASPFSIICSTISSSCSPR